MTEPDATVTSPASAPLTDERLADRFVVRRQLGEGGMGIVYEAFDEERGETVAVKTLGRVGAKQIAGLKREFRSLADIVHPNLVRLHELFNDGGRWFFTMQRVEGVSFLAYLRGDELDNDGATLDDTMPSSAVSELVLRAALRQLCEGLLAIHGAGKLHRDIKPSNVLVTEAGQVMILDFGLVQALEPGAERSLELGAAGTPAYMAPEQLREGGATMASDWYAVGGMLYQALTGRLPFEAGTIAQLLAAKQSGKAPPSPRELAPDAPDDLAELALALLAHEPAERPDGASVVAQLGEALPPATVRPEPEPLFVGREHELSVLAAAYARAAGASPWSSTWLGRAASARARCANASSPRPASTRWCCADAATSGRTCRSKRSTRWSTRSVATSAGPAASQPRS